MTVSALVDAAPGNALGRRVRLAVSSLGLAVGKPYTLTLDGEAVKFFADRREALVWFEYVGQAIDGP